MINAKVTAVVEGSKGFRTMLRLKDNGAGMNKTIIMNLYCLFNFHIQESYQIYHLLFIV